MSDHAPFLAEICQHPQDDAPRLVYADWLEERGDPRAEFIRLQCELARLPAHDLRRTELEGRELSLIRLHSKGWASPVRRLVRNWTFHRGFVEQVAIDTRRFLEHGDELFGLAPIRDAQFLRADHHLAELSRSPHFGRLDSVNLGHQFLFARPRQSQSAPMRLAEFLRSPGVQALRGMELCGSGLQIADPDAESLTSGALANLQSLDVRRNYLTARGHARICRAFPELRSLRLGPCLRHTVDPVQALANDLTPLAPQLETLELHDAGVTVRHLEALQSPAPRLRALSLAGADLRLQGDSTLSRLFTGARRLAERAQWVEPLPTPMTGFSWFDEVETLDLSRSQVEGDLLGLLLDSGRLKSVRTLDLSHNPIYSVGAERIAQSALPALARLRLNGGMSQTGLSSHQIENRGLRALAQSASLPRLAAIEVRRNQISDAGLQGLVESPLVERLYYLDLRQNLISDKGARELAARGPWPRLAYLNLRQNRISREGQRQLVAKFGWRVIV